jgi:hypothetical protein
MKKVDPTKLSNLEEGKEYTPESVFSLQLAEPGTVICAKGKEQYIVGYGDNFKFEWPEGYKLIVTQPGTMTVSKKPTKKPTGEVFTNFDKRPELSPIEKILKVKMREFQRETERLREKRLEASREMLAKSETTVKPEKAPPAKEGEAEVEKKTDETEKKDEKNAS